jgi:hypothetical protein
LLLIFNPLQLDATPSFNLRIVTDLWSGKMNSIKD